VVTRSDGAALIVARLGECHWQVRVEPTDAARVEGTLLTLVHIEHRHWQVYVTAVGESLAGVALVGPGANGAAEAVLGRPPVEGVVAPLTDQRFGPGHIWSYRSAGRPVVELRVPAGRAARVWRALLAGGSPSNGKGSLPAAPGRTTLRVRPVGFQALEGRARG
jgi:glycine cleavage system aminomethyltransferase T